MGPNMHPSQTMHLFSRSPLKNLGIDFFLRNTAFLLDPFSLRVECSQPFFWEICSVTGVWHPRTKLRDMAGSGLHFQTKQFRFFRGFLLSLIFLLRHQISVSLSQNSHSTAPAHWESKYFPLSWRISNSRVTMTEPRVSQNMPFLTRRPQNKIVSQGWRDSSAIKSTCCFCKRTWVQFHELTRHNCNSSSKGSDHLWPPQASAHTYIQANGHTYKYLKRKEIVAISL